MSIKDMLGTAQAPATTDTVTGTSFTTDFDRHMRVAQAQLNNSTNPGIYGSGIGSMAPHISWDTSVRPSATEDHTQVLVHITRPDLDVDKFLVLTLAQDVNVVAYTGADDLLSFTIGEKFTPESAGKFMAWVGMLPSLS